TADRSSPVRSFFTVIVTPGITAPVWSFTAPVIRPWSTWPIAAMVTVSMITIAHTKFFDFPKVKDFLLLSLKTWVTSQPTACSRLADESTLGNLGRAGQPLMNE